MKVKTKKKLRKKIVFSYHQIQRFHDFIVKFPQDFFFLLVTCHIRYNLLQHSTEPKITLENKRKCEISKQSARIKVREISEHCWRKATN